MLSMWGYLWDWCRNFKWCRTWQPDIFQGWENTYYVCPALAALHFRIEFKVLTMTYKALNGLRISGGTPPPTRSTRITRFSQDGRLRGLKPRETQREWTRKWAFLVVAPHLWNSLPPEICLAPLLGVFKNQLKTWIFRQAFSPVNTWFIVSLVV